MKPMTEKHRAILRRHMVEVILFHADFPEEELGKAVFDEQVLAVMLRIPRHLFVPGSLAHLAYEDIPLPIGFEKTISQPFMCAHKQRSAAASVPRSVRCAIVFQQYNPFQNMTVLGNITVAPIKIQKRNRRLLVRILDLLSINHDLAAVGVQQPHKDPEQRALAGTGRPDNADDLAVPRLTPRSRGRAP